MIGIPFQDLVRVAKIAHKMVCNPSTYKPSPVKRVWIPKGKNEKRPIGMPTVIDRVIQAIYLEAIDPIVEEQSCKNSMGFRKLRGSTDGALAFRSKISV